MIARTILLFALAAICGSTAGASDDGVVRRAVQHRRAAMHQRRGLAMDAPPRMIRKVRRDDSSAYPEAHLGNIAAMKKYVKELKQMNEDWQAASMKSLKEGKIPSEFPSTDEIANASPAPKSNKQNNPYDAGDSESSPKHKAHPQKHQPKPKAQPEPQPQHKKHAPAPVQKPDSVQTPKHAHPAKAAVGGGLHLPGGVSASYPHGSMTYYTTGLGACGWTNSDNDYIVALSEELWNQFGTMSNGNPVCGRKVRITKDGKQAVATITDQCPGCEKSHLDMSPALFKHFAQLTVGLTDISWEFI